MTNLSPAAQAVLTAATQKLYCLDPEDVPISASEYGSVIAAALRAVAEQWKNEIRKQPNTEFISGIKNCIDALNEVADELERQ